MESSRVRLMRISACGSGTDPLCRYIECHSKSSHPINRYLPEHIQAQQKEAIKKNLKPTVLLYKSEPHEAAFALCAELFPSIKAIRFLPDPQSQHLDVVHASTSTVVGESVLDLINRKVPYFRPSAPGYPDYYYATGTAPKIKVVEILKKGFEYQDLSSLGLGKVQSSIRVKGSAGLDFYSEDWKQYPDGGEAMPYTLSKRYLVSPSIVSALESHLTKFLCVTVQL